jgi:hypothetical protein
MTEKVKCARTGCKHRTADPKAAGWVYMDETPADFSHWVGWWCPKCIIAFQRLMQELGAEGTKEPLQ